MKKAGDGNRTHVSSLEGWCSTIELHPHMQCLVPESNQRHEDFQSSALPTELTRLTIPRIICIDDFILILCFCQEKNVLISHNFSFTIMFIHITK